MTTDPREYWLRQLRRLADPVLDALRRRELRQSMPLESSVDRSDCSHMEAFGRLLCGLAPWLELESDDTAEGALRRRYAQVALEAIAAAVDPASPDYLWAPPGELQPPDQLLVDTAFFAHALLRAPRKLIGGMAPGVRRMTAELLLRSRVITPGANNWLLFSAMVEAALLKMEFPADLTRIAYALRQHDQWFKGDGIYGDGRNFAFDYYNSYVIQPMLLDITAAVAGRSEEWEALHRKVLRRIRRYAVIQERLIAPEAPSPPSGVPSPTAAGLFRRSARSRCAGSCRKNCIRQPSARRSRRSSSARWTRRARGMKTAGSGSASAATSPASAKAIFQPAASIWPRPRSCRSDSRRRMNSGAPRRNRGAP